VQVFKREGTDKFLKLCIWDNPYLIEAGIHPSIPIGLKILHSYLRRTQPKANRKLVGFLDKVLTRVYGF
jgi:hypothetical protein